MSLTVCERLKVVPYVRGRLAFAGLAAQAAAEADFDCVALDWPGFLSPFLPVVLERLPLITALLIPHDSNCALLPFTPAEPACAAAWVARRRSLELACVDDPRFSGCSEGCLFHPDLSPAADDSLQLAALDQYFAPLWRRMEALWPEAPECTRRMATARAAFLANRVKQLLACGRRVLLISEYRLWWSALRQWERKQEPAEQPAEAGRPAALIFEDPVLLWAAGFFDEFPSLLPAFFESLAAGQPDRFDAPARLRALLGELAGAIPAESAACLPGELLDRLQAHAGIHRALECARRLLSYPAPKAADAGDALPSYLTLGSDGVAAEAPPFELPDVLHCAPYYQRSPGERDRWLPFQERERRLDWAGWARPFISRQEAKQLKGPRGMVRFAARQDYRLHRQVCAEIRDLARRRYPSCPPLDEYTPVAFLFGPESESCASGAVHDSNPAQRVIELGGGVNARPDSQPDQVYSLYYTVRAREEVFAPLLEREILNSLVLLYTGEEMGPDRYAMITRRPKQYQCRVQPDWDPALQAFPAVDRGVAWAVRYAPGAVIVVHHEDWKPSLPLAAFALQRRVCLLQIPLTALSDAIVERLRRMHYMATPLKRHPESERIVGRFLPPPFGERVLGHAPCGAATPL